MKSARHRYPLARGNPPIRSFALALSLASLACSRPPAPLTAQTDPAAAEEAARTITAEDLRREIGVIAHDSMRGRDTPSPELEQTARYIAARFDSFGLLPADGDSFLQAFPLTFSTPGPAADQRVRVEGPGGGELDPADFIVLPGGGGLAAAPLVVSDPSGAGDLTGRLALVPVSEANITGVFSSLRTILDRGADGLLLVVDAPDEYFRGLERFFSTERLSVGVPDELGAPAVLVRARALPASLSEAVARGGPVPGDFRAELRTSSRFRQDQAFNTVGWIEGSDPALRDEYLVFTAHMDHVGVGRPVGGDSIYNGADDDASGTAAILELAEAFASLETPPRRSLVFMTVSGEEKGLLGSAWYADHPLFPLEATVANLNIDMIGRNWRDTVVAIGREESTLGEVLESVVAARPELGLTMIDDPWPEERFYFRSDHYNFARAGVPILFFFTGTHEDYHRPDDEPDRILYDKTARIARLIFHLGLAVADADERPRWDPEAYRRVVESGGS